MALHALTDERPQQRAGAGLHGERTSLPSRDGLRCDIKQLGQIHRAHPERLAHEAKRLALAHSMLGEPCGGEKIGALELRERDVPRATLLTRVGVHAHIEHVASDLDLTIFGDTPELGVSTLGTAFHIGLLLSGRGGPLSRLWATSREACSRMRLSDVLG